MARQKLVELDVICKRYGQLPSDVAKGDIEDFVLNLLVAEKGIDAENKAIEKANKKWRKAPKRR